MNFIIIFFIGTLVGAGFAYHFLYSPKAMIKKLWKEIYKLNELKVGGSKDSVMAYVVNGSTDESIAKRKEIINSLLNYLDSENDKEFIELHKP